MMGGLGKIRAFGPARGWLYCHPPRQRCRVFRFFGFDMPGV